MSRPLVSVVIPTYQHEGLISQCIDSAASQVGAFELEILVGEDGSTDRTRAHCLQKAAEYPGLVRVYCNDDRSRMIRIRDRPTGRRNLTDLISASRGSFVSILEGDDCWTDSQRIEKLLRALDDPTISASFHQVQTVRVDTGERMEVLPAKGPERFSTQHLVERQSVPGIHSLLFRRSALPLPWPDWFLYEAPLGDWPLAVLASLHGDLSYVAECMGDRTVGHGSNAWAGRGRARVHEDLAATYDLLAEHVLRGTLSESARSLAQRRRLRATVRLLAAGDAAEHLTGGPWDQLPPARKALGLALSAASVSSPTRRATSRLLRMALRLR